jgi:hypothetical protein
MFKDTICYNIVFYTKPAPQPFPEPEPEPKKNDSGSENLRAVGSDSGSGFT